MEIRKIAEAIQQSNYFVSAVGCRDVGSEELIKLIKIIRSNDSGLMAGNFETLYKYHPDTIAMDRESYEE
jgi:hypothetical protein